MPARRSDPATPGLAQTIDAGLRASTDPARAESERAYLKSDRQFLGVGVPVTRRIVRDAFRAHPPADRAALWRAVDGLWGGEAFEHRRAAVEVLVIGRELLGVADLDRLESMCRDAETWALLDELAVRVVGSIVERFPADSGGVLDRWATDFGSFWVRRAALLALLEPLRAGGGDFERFGRYADSMLHEREFFIRKAIGWVLRDTSKRRPELVRAWVEPRLDAMSGVTRREATRYL